MPAWLLASVAVLFIGLSKAGFGGGLGMLTTPLCVMAFGPSQAIGILLPLLCAGDVFSLYHYWRKWRVENLWFLLPGMVIGVAIGAQLFNRFSPRELNIIIGTMAVLFVLYQLVKATVFRNLQRFVPNHGLGLICGVAAGVTSTFAHGAGPVVNAFLIPQRFSKEIYTGTTVLVFTWMNGIKIPFFLYGGLITQQTFSVSVLYFALIPVGVWVGVWLNRRIPENLFVKLVYLFTFLTGIQLVFEFKF